MTQRKAKRGLTVFLMIGIIFTAIGIGYLMAAIVIRLSAVVREKGESTFRVLIFGMLGVIFSIVGGIFLVIEIKKRIRDTKLLNAGNYITAEIVEINICYNVRMNYRHPYVVVCQYQDMEGNVHLFKSRYLYFNPEPLLKDRFVRVYVEAQNYKHYYVDIDEVLPNVVTH